MMTFKDVRIRGLKVDKQTPNQNVELTLCFPASGHSTLLDELKTMCIDVTDMGSKQHEYIIRAESDKPFKCELTPDDHEATNGWNLEAVYHSHALTLDQKILYEWFHDHSDAFREIDFGVYGKKRMVDVMLAWRKALSFDSVISKQAAHEICRKLGLDLRRSIGSSVPCIFCTGKYDKKPDQSASDDNEKPKR